MLNRKLVEAGFAESEPGSTNLIAFPPPLPPGSWLVLPGTSPCLMATLTGLVLCTCVHSLPTRTTVSGWTSQRKVRGRRWGLALGQESAGGAVSTEGDLEELSGLPGQFPVPSCPAGRRER